MRALKYSVLICVAALVWLTGYLSLRSFQAEGASLKTCALMSGPFLIWAAGALTSMYVITGLAWVIWNVQMDRLPVNCFREAFLAKVAAYQQCGDEMSASGTDAPAAHTELRVDGK